MIKRIAINLFVDTIQPAEVVNHVRDGFALDFYICSRSDLANMPAFESEYPQLVPLYENSYGHWLNNLKIMAQMSRGVTYDAIYSSTHLDLTWPTQVFQRNRMEIDFVFLPKVSEKYPDVFLPEYQTSLAYPSTSWTLSMLWKTLRYWDVTKAIYRPFDERFRDSKVTDYVGRLDQYVWNLWCINQHIRVRQ